MTDAPEFEYLRLVQYGTEPDVVTAAVNYAQAALPQWEPRVGNTEMVLIESLALILGVEVLAIQLLPGQIVEQLMRLYGITRDPGVGAVGRVQFTVTNSSPVQTIPAETRLRFSLEATGETIDVLTREAVSIITTETLTGQVDVIADQTGTAGNGTPVGTRLDLVDNLAFIESAVLVTAISGGLEVESDDLFYGRAAATLARLTTTLVGPDSFQYAALTQTGVGRAKVFDLYNPAAPVSAPVLSAPTTATTGGSLAAATYFYKATYTNAAGETVGSNEVSQVTTGTTSTVTFTIGAAPAGATGTKIYRSTTTGTQVLLDTLTTTPTTYTDNGSKTPGTATVPTVGTATTPLDGAVGHVTVAVADAAGQALTANAMTDLQNWLAGQALASLGIHVIAPTYTTVNLAVTVKAVPGYTEQQVVDAVTAAVKAWVSPVTWDWSPILSQYGLVAQIAGASGVKQVTSVPADIALAGKAPLPLLGTLTVTVTA